MGRSLLIVALVGFFTLSGVASASPEIDVRLPIETARASVSARLVTVQAGDHLWSISEHHLGDRPPDMSVAPYWRRVVLLNTPHLRSGDPDLIYPGEIIEMPGLSEQP